MTGAAVAGSDPDCSSPPRSSVPVPWSPPAKPVLNKAAACFGQCCSHVLAQIVLQSLAARVGVIGGVGLGESIRSTLTDSWLGKLFIALVIVAIGCGNAAYQTGNLTGAAKGVHAIAGGHLELWIALIAGGASVVLLAGGYRWMHGALVGLVVLLSASFLLAAWVNMPSIGNVVRGMLVPHFAASDLTIVLALIGTTIVPYNLFLHASGAAATWKGMTPQVAVQQSDRDTTLAVGLGGCVTASILITASVAFYEAGASWTGIDSISDQLEPTLGRWSASAFAIGLFAAGLTSSITAPMATAFALCGCLGMASEPRGLIFRVFALGTVIVGCGFALAFGKSPALTIVLAQVANGVLLPVIACFLLFVLVKMKQTEPKLIGAVRFRLAQGIVLAVCMLGIWRIVSLMV